MQLVRIVAPHFVAGLETDGTVQRAAPIIGYMVGWSDDQVRDHVRQKGWKASILDAPTRVIQHWESFEVWRGGKRRFFFFDDNAGRRAITGRQTKEAALREALAFAKVEKDQIEIRQQGPPPW
jgi:hypothetical protein